MAQLEIIEVGPRDGLQNEEIFVPTETKIAFINQLSECGFHTIETTSFVSPRWVPQMADHSEVFRAINKKPTIHYPVLTPNLKGLEAALEVGVKDIAVFVAASETFSQKNTNCSIAESLQRVKEICDVALGQGIRVRGYISCIFHCPYEGLITPEKVLPVLESLLALGCAEISLGDTTGHGTPTQTRALFHYLQRNNIDSQILAGHFHDTDGHALENIEVAYQEFAIHRFDSSIAGLGGCPYSPGATGNVATEKVVQYFKEKNIATGIDFDKLLAVKNFIRAALRSLQTDLS